MRMRVRVLFAQQQGLSHGCNCCWWMAHASSAAQQMTVAAYYVEHTLTPSHSHIPTHGNTIQAKKKQMRKRKAPGHSHIRLNSQALLEFGIGKRFGGNAQVLQSEIHKWYFAFYLLTYNKTKRISSTSCFSYSLLGVCIFYFFLKNFYFYTYFML